MRILSKITVVCSMVLLSALTISSAGCSSATPSVLPPSQQILRFPVATAGSVDLHTIDPALVAFIGSYVPVELVFPALITLNAAGTPMPWAAAAMPTFDPTADTYTFKVRPGLRWSDGTPIDAGTFAYSINRSLNPCTGSLLASYLYSIKDAEAYSGESCGSDGVTAKGPIKTLVSDSILVPDSQTLVIKLNAPAPYFLEAFCYPTTYAQPEQLINKYGNKTWTDHLADGSGFGGNLFKVSLWDHTGNLDLVRNTDFWGTPAKLQQVDYKIYQSQSAEYADYLDGRLDEASAPPAEYAVSKKRSDFHEVPYLEINYYQPNWAKPPFNDVRVRQAFDLALDKDVLANQVNQGTVLATNHIVPQGMPGYDTTLVGPDGSAGTAGNVAKATALMQSYADDHCGGQISKCPAVTLFDADDPAIVTADQAAVGMWQTAFPGLTIQTRFLSGSDLYSVIYGADVPQIFGIGWSADYPDPQDWLSLQFGDGASNNLGSVSVPAANVLMAEADQNLDPTSRWLEYNQAEQLLVTNVAWIPLDQAKQYWNVQPYVHNFSLDALGLLPLGGSSSWQTIYLTSH